MTPEELAQLKDAFSDTISEHTKASTKEVKDAIAEHSRGNDHRFVQTWRMKEQRKTEMWEKVKGNFVFWLVAGGLGTIGTAIWQYLKHSLGKG